MVMRNFRKQNRKRQPVQDISGWPRDTGTPRITHINDGELDFYRRRAMYSSAVVVFFFIILITRLWYLQIQQGEKYSELAKNNRVRYLEIAAPRGNILDRKGREIVTNRPSFNVVWVREKNRVDDALIKKTAAILDVEISELLARTRKMVGTPGHIPIRLAEELSWDQVAYIENNRMELPGIKIEVVPQRVYHYGNLASHIIGYLGE
ncbi:MAG: penicillin-binding protein 2, partial [Candidatus Electrothrix sp. ATG1]|nr:penicillin-binding protein 2 [Candidatus Electrothrix sp. ATG1]